MKELTKKIIKDHRLGLILISVSLLLLIWFYVAFFPSLTKIDIDKLLNAYPKSLKAAFGLDKISFSTLEGFMNAEFYSLMWIILIGGYLIAFVTSEFTKQFEDGTIESLLSLPISRFKIMLTKWLNMFGITIAFVFLATVPVFAFAKIYDINIGTKSFLTVALLGILFFTSIGSFTLALAVFFNERSKAVAIPIALLSFGYIWNSITQVVDKVKDLKFLSIIYFFDTAKALADKKIALTSIFLFSSIIIISTIFAFYWFMHRDFAI